MKSELADSVDVASVDVAPVGAANQRQPVQNLSRRKKLTQMRHAIFFLLAAFGALMGFLDRYGQTDRAAPADAIVVLGAHVLASGEPGKSLSARTKHAAALYHRGLARVVICTGGLGTHAPAESEASAALLRNSGVLSGDILQENTSTSTWQNIENATQLCRERGWKRVIVVSDPYHLFRARRNFARFGIEAYPSPSPNQPLPTRLYMTTREVFSVLRDVALGR